VAARLGGCVPGPLHPIARRSGEISSPTCTSASAVPSIAPCEKPGDEARRVLWYRHALTAARIQLSHSRVRRGIEQHGT
jgi:hypothetical protein